MFPFFPMYFQIGIPLPAPFILTRTPSKINSSLTPNPFHPISQPQSQKITLSHNQFHSRPKQLQCVSRFKKPQESNDSYKGVGEEIGEIESTTGVVLGVLSESYRSVVLLVVKAFLFVPSDDVFECRGFKFFG